jgi:hypothetical protein
MKDNTITKRDIKYYTAIFVSIAVFVSILLSGVIHVENKNIFPLSKTEALVSRQLTSIDEECLPKKKLIISLGKAGGLGSRMMAIASAAVMAAMTDRVLEVKWDPLPHCQETFDNLFRPRQPEYNIQVLQYDGLPKSKFKSRAKEGTVCSLLLKGDTEKQVIHFLLINTMKGLNRLNKECDQIVIESNLYFAHILLGPEMGHFGQIMRLILNNPFRHMSNIIFPSAGDIRMEVKAMKTKLTSGGGTNKWLSIHARGIFSHGTDSTGKALECANALLAAGEIAHVFFATDSPDLQKFAQSKITVPGALIVTDKDLPPLAPNGDSPGLRTTPGIHDALVDWYLIGDADYCLSPSIDQSQFSKTAIARGTCQYLNYHLGADCLTKYEKVEKDRFLYTFRNHLSTDMPIYGTPTLDLDVVFKTLQRSAEEIEDDCVMYDSPESVIIDFWRDDGEELLDPELKANVRPASKYFGTKHFESLMQYIHPSKESLMEKKLVKAELLISRVEQTGSKEPKSD